MPPDFTGVIRHIALDRGGEPRTYRERSRVPQRRRTSRRLRSAAGGRHPAPAQHCRALLLPRGDVSGTRSAKEEKCHTTPDGHWRIGLLHAEAIEKRLRRYLPRRSKCAANRKRSPDERAN